LKLLTDIFRCNIFNDKNFTEECLKYIYGVVSQIPYNVILRGRILKNSSSLPVDWSLMYEYHITDIEKITNQLKNVMEIN
jgi:hypothetical protein